jgi:hypothetical protein
MAEPLQRRFLLLSRSSAESGTARELTSDALPVPDLAVRLVRCTPTTRRLPARAHYCPASYQDWRAELNTGHSPPGARPAPPPRPDRLQVPAAGRSRPPYPGPGAANSTVGSASRPTPSAAAGTAFSHASCCYQIAGILPPGCRQLPSQPVRRAQWELRQLCAHCRSRKIRAPWSLLGLLRPLTFRRA